MPVQTTLFDKRFLGRHAGQIMADPTVALVELVANAWDAYATKVDISWPDQKAGSPFTIRDNGCGMSKAEFETRWRTLDYDRLQHQGGMVDPPIEMKDGRPRRVYGQNGRGRHAAFKFSSPYVVRTWKGGFCSEFKVSQGTQTPIEIELLQEFEMDGHGTEVIGIDVIPSHLEPDAIRSLLSTRFLLDPSFMVSVNGVNVTFDDIPTESIETIIVDIPKVGKATIRVIDSEKTDRTTKQHGIAWWVQSRLVGEPSWTDFEEKFVDGRREEAKRFSFIVSADFLKPEVLPDWSGFKPESEKVKLTRDAVHEEIRRVLTDLLRARRQIVRDAVTSAHINAVKALPRISQARWTATLDVLIERCPSLGEKQLDQVMGLLATLESSTSQYALLEKLHQLSPKDVDEWNRILEEWTLRTASEALDEISKRLKLIEEIRIKAENKLTDEVQELQPLFGQALWIFGPQFESIEFTSNRGMTTVIRDLFGGSEKGSKNRPDFVVLPESSIGFYARPSFDQEHNEVGTDAVVVVELKRPGVGIGEHEKSQAWKYIKELKVRGYINEDTYVTAFVLGDQIEAGESTPRNEGDRVVIRPMLYSTFLGQAEKRMMNLGSRLKDAPFMNVTPDAEDTSLIQELI